jgi:putative heme transporter
MDGMAGVGSEQREEHGDRQGPEPAPERDRDAAAAAPDQPGTSGAEAEDAGAPSSAITRKRLIQTAVVVLLLIGGIYFLFPKIVGVQGTVNRLGDATPGWLAVALAMDVAAYLAYVALFRGVVGRGLHLRFREAYEITMAGLAAALLFAAGGAGGVVLNYWAIRKAGLEAGRAACRLVAFLVLLYGVYVLTVVVNGILLRVGVLHGPHPVGLTIVPAGIAALLIVLFLLLTLIPGDFERRFAGASETSRRGRFAHRFATVPATLARGTRTALDLVRNPSDGGWLAIVGALGYWAANIGILWASFHGYGVSVPLGVVIQGFFIGLAANLFPFAPAGVGAVDAGMIGVFVLFGFPGADVFAAVLTYRLFAFWLPIPPGIVAFFQLRRTVARWDRGERPAARVSGVTAGAEATL